jgi:hypothetical protein
MQVDRKFSFRNSLRGEHDELIFSAPALMIVVLAPAAAAEQLLYSSQQTGTLNTFLVVIRGYAGSIVLSEAMQQQQIALQITLLFSH